MHELMGWAGCIMNANEQFLLPNMKAAPNRRGGYRNIGLAFTCANLHVKNSC